MTSDPDDETWVALELARLQRKEDQLDQLVKDVAGLIIGRHEHANAIRRLLADTNRHEQELATVRAGITDARRAVDQLAQQVNAVSPKTALELYEAFGAVVDSTRQRLLLIEQALPELERKVGLRRRTDAWGGKIDDREASAGGADGGGPGGLRQLPRPDDPSASAD